jgi:hypothetical protein
MATTGRSPRLPAANFRQQLRSELPRLLREDPDLRRELAEVFQDVFPSHAEVAELRALRADFNRSTQEAAQRFEVTVRRFEAMDRRFEELRTDMNQRFEAMDRRFEELRTDMNQRFEATDRHFEELRTDMNQRFEATDRRFEIVLSELRSQRLHLSRLSGRIGYGLEHIVRGMVEEFAGRAMARAERLILRDAEGEVFGVPADIEFDMFASDGEAYLCEVKSHIEKDDVLRFHKKALFATKHIDRPFIRLMIGTSMEAAAEKQMKVLGIRPLVRARIDLDDSVTSLL